MDYIVSDLKSANSMFQNVNLSISNYDSLLIGWSKLNLQHNVIFDGGYSQYNSTAVPSRLNIIDTFNWAVSDGGLIPGPTAPESLSISVGNSTVSLSWSAPTNNGTSPIINYDIFRSEQANSGFKLIGTTIKLTFTDTGLTDGVKYYYIIEAVNSITAGTNSTIISGTPLSPTPPSPTTTSTITPTTTSTSTPTSTPTSTSTSTPTSTSTSSATTTSTSVSSPSTISPNKSSPVYLIGIIFALATITALRVKKQHKRVK